MVRVKVKKALTKEEKEARKAYKKYVNKMARKEAYKRNKIGI